MACLQRPYISSSSWSVGLVFTFFTFSAYCSNSAYSHRDHDLLCFPCDPITILLSSNVYLLILSHSLTHFAPLSTFLITMHHSCIILRLHAAYCSVSQRTNSFACQHECSLYPYKPTGYVLANLKSDFSSLISQLHDFHMKLIVCGQPIYIAQLFARARIKGKMTFTSAHPEAADENSTKTILISGCVICAWAHDENKMSFCLYS